MTDQKETLKHLIEKSIIDLEKVYNRISKKETNHTIKELELKTKVINKLFYLICDITLLKYDALLLEKGRNE